MSAWYQWERSLEDTPPDGEEVGPTRPERSSRRARRRAERRARRGATRSTQRALRRRYLADMEAVPGVAVLVVAVIVVGAAIWWSLGRDDDADTAIAAASSSSGGGGGSTSAAVPSAPAVPIVLDPHAGAEVLPPRSMPPSPPEPAAAADPLAAATAFATQACAWLEGESVSGYVERLAPLATPELAAAWQHGSGPRVGCMQLTAQATGADTALVQAVQVYADSSAESGRRAYRWSASLSLVLTDGQWLVAS